MTEYHTIQREIGIDAGHRVTDHGSKCRNVHGHRYTVRAYCEGKLRVEGEQAGMVLDFGFLKEEMMTVIDAPCDHGMIFWRADELMCKMFEPRIDDFDTDLHNFGDHGDFHCHTLNEWNYTVDDIISKSGYCEARGRDGIKIYIVPFVPTAENLARHWFRRLQPRVVRRSGQLARLLKVRVEETPNCWAEYSRPNDNGIIWK
jgi:6-pyruvoyltetrahydropterin/6-carboxytetrahydropterin synthase